jgi:hypothetical protein
MVSDRVETRVRLSRPDDHQSIATTGDTRDDSTNTYNLALPGRQQTAIVRMRQTHDVRLVRVFDRVTHVNCDRAAVTHYRPYAHRVVQTARAQCVSRVRTT